MAKITFEMPRGDQEFDDLDPGEKMTVSCTIQKEGQDKACLVSVAGKTLTGYSEGDDSTEEETTEKEDDGIEGSDEGGDGGDMMSALDKQM